MAPGEVPHFRTFALPHSRTQKSRPARDAPGGLSSVQRAAAQEAGRVVASVQVPLPLYEYTRQR
jgi:hypothetical protein